MKTRIIKIQFRVFALICFTILATISKGQEFEILFPSNGIPEGFETGVKPAGWESRIIKGTLPWKYQSGGYLYNPLNAFSGTNNAIFQAQSREAIAKLITPAIDLKRSEEGEAPITIKPTLVFWHAQVDWSGDLDELKVYYRENITSEWKLLDHYTSEVRNWTKQEILLPDAAKTSTCQIAFEGISNWGYGTCIDDVRIEERGIIPRKIETFQVKQYNDNYPTGSENNPFSYVKVLVSGNTNEIPVNSITLNYSGTDINDLSSIRLFHTRDSLFKVSTPLNATVTYNGNKITLTAPLFNLNTGTNYIWIALGIENNSTHGNMVDFYIDPNDVVLGTESFPLSVLTPNGTATIHESLIFTDFEGANDWTKTSLWEIGEPLGTGAYDATYAYSESKV
ncbi:MAG: BNR-repeat neuraminidase N-terminal domain-containing protein, partial [Bacteroidales bacterium]|nr:BNR-repeat neuraminidase N-terminal domain-containing protein [Bacteroidales bacterium]